MTEFEKFFIKVMDWYKQNEVDVMVHGSTLLNIVRNGTPEPNEGLKTDKEINLMVFAEDLTDDKEWLLRQDSGYFKPIWSDAHEVKSSGVFYSFESKEFPTDSHWNLRPGFVFLTKLWKGKNFRFKCHTGDDFIQIPNRFVAEKAKWVDLYILDSEFKAPAEVGGYLDYYYGDWWIRKPGWHWKGSPNLVKYHKLVNDGEKCWE